MKTLSVKKLALALGLVMILICALALPALAADANADAPTVQPISAEAPEAPTEAPEAPTAEEDTGAGSVGVKAIAAALAVGIAAAAGAIAMGIIDFSCLSKSKTVIPILDCFLFISHSILIQSGKYFFFRKSKTVRIQI